MGVCDTCARNIVPGTAMPAHRARRTSLALAVIAALAGSGVTAASATGLDILNPATDEELGPVTFQGLIVSPDVSYDTLDLGDAGAQLLEDPDGFRAGAELGYDWQRGNLMFGIVGDATYSWIDGGGDNAGEGIFSSDLNYMGTLRGRLGVAFDRLLIYGTGGYAFGELEVTNDVAGISDKNALSGWAAGGGIEYVWNKSITLRGEYIRLDYGSESYTSLPAGSQDLSAGMNMFNFGLVTRY